MRLLLVNPPRHNGIPVIREDRCEITERNSVIPPYSLMQLAAILRDKGHEVTLIDANGEDISYQEFEKRLLSLKEIGAVVLRFTPTTFDHDLRVADIAKATNAQIVTIGLCWTLQTFAQGILENCDSLDIYALGDSESTVPNLIDTLDGKGREGLAAVRGLSYKADSSVLYSGAADDDTDPDALPMPAFDLVDARRYYNNTKRKTRYMIIYTSKGCPYGCIYCTVRRTKWKAKSAPKVIEEVDHLVRNLRIRELSFFDETFTMERQRAIDICQGLLDKGINATWYCNTRVDRVDPGLLELMRKAGCRGISYGIESGSELILKNAQKGNTVEQAYQAIKWTKEAGIKTYAALMVGLPGESWATVEETRRFIQRALPNGAQFNVAVPYPGTELYEIARANGWIGEDVDWRALYQHSSIMRTAEMSPEELDQARRMLYRSLYFNPRWVTENVKFLVRNPRDIPLAIGYYLKSLKGYLTGGMKHVH